jgi:branched-chain amino acid transport system permease protein
MAWKKLMMPGELQQIGQAIANAVAAGAGYGLLAASFTLISRSGRFFHLAHGALFAAGGYGAFIGFQAIGLPGLAVGIVAACAVGASTELLVYRPLRRRHASPLVLLLSSLGVYLVVQSSISMCFGNETRLLLPTGLRSTVHTHLGNVSMAQAITVAFCAAASLGLWALLAFTRTGRAMRAVATDLELAAVVGVRTDRTVLDAMIVGSVLAGASGVLAGCDLDLVPTMGMRAVLVSLAAAVIGGMRNPLRAVLGGLALGFMEALTAWVFPARWQDVTMYALLAIILLLRPSRVFGLAVEKA